MSIKRFEIFHGIALAKLLRSGKPVSLRMIETRPLSEDWRIYTINIDCDLFVKHRTNRKRGGDKNGNHAWQFSFTPSEISRILTKDKQVFVALVCGQMNLQDGMEICFLKPEQIMEIFPPESDKTFSFTVKAKPSRMLWVVVERKLRTKVRRNEIEYWDIPGS